MSKPVTLALRLLPFLALSVVVGIWILDPPPTWFGFRLRGFMGVGADKFAHAIGAGALFAAALPAMRYLDPGGSFARRALIAAVVLIVAGGLIELYQISHPLREAEWADFVANVIGIAVVAFACLAWDVARRTWRGIPSEPSPELLRARRLLAPLPLRFVEVGAVSGDRIRHDLAGGEDALIAQVTPDAPEQSRIQRAERPARSARAAPTASPGDRGVALPAPRLGGRARLRPTAVLPKRSSEIGSGGDPTRRGLRRRRSCGQRDSRRGAGIRTRPYCRDPRHLRT